MSNKRLLIAFAHPDDESFGLGGLIAKYVAQGIDVYLICATDGDVGTVEPKYLEGYNSIRELRLAELDCAATTLGFKEVFKFGYKDSGMMGSTTCDDEGCLWYASQHQPEALTRRVVDVIRKVRPQVVITFNEYGGYGHPDHIAIQRATTEAFTLAGDSSYLSEASPYQPQKLYYNNIPTFFLKLGLLWLRLRGKDPRKMGVNQDIDLQAIMDNIEPSHAEIDVRDYLDAWDEASACHASQGGGRGFSLPMWLRRMVGTKQGFTRIYPQPLQDRVDEYDLFAGVSLDEPVLV